jgi:serine/threonine kinase 32
VIGRGGYGVVRIVQKKDTKEKFALKYINKKKCIKKNSLKNILRERMFLETCDHPFIINLQFAFHDDVHMFLIMDLATGGDLRFHLVRVGILPEQTVRIYAAEIASAIEYMHSQNIIHRYSDFDQRDIKPENLLLSERGHIYLTDFNSAIMLNEKTPTSISGTTSYMGIFRFNAAPEMLISMPYTYSVDWWALGVIIYECTYNMVMTKVYSASISHRQSCFSSNCHLEFRTIFSGSFITRY